MEDNTGIKLIGGGIAIFIAIIILFIFFPVVFVSATERGIVYNTGSGGLRVVGPGTHWRTPLLEHVTKISVKTEKTEVGASAASKDLQTVNTKIIATWHAEAGRVDRIYQEVGDIDAITDRVVTPALNETVKAATAKYTAEELLTKRPLLKAELDKTLADRLLKRHIILEDVSIVDIDFSPEFNRAIERKAQAEQDALAEKNKLKAVEYRAEQTLTKAKADAESIRIQTEALSENQNLVEYEKAKRWDGHLPTTVLGDSVPFINLK